MVPQPRPGNTRSARPRAMARRTRLSRRSLPPKCRALSWIPPTRRSISPRTTAPCRSPAWSACNNGGSRRPTAPEHLPRSPSMSFNIALTGLSAATQDLSVTSNNLANSQTVGFKASRTEFGDIFASTQTGVASTAVGNGVRVQEVAQLFSQGNTKTTGNSLDLAINGNGFFTVSNNGSLSYTRDGEFQLNNAGQVVTASGGHLQVYAPLPTGGFNTGGLSD